MTYPVTIERPRDLSAAARRLHALQSKGAPIGGGLELLELYQHADPAAPDVLIPIRQIADVSTIRVSPGEVHIGAAATLAEVADSMGVKRYAWPLSEAAQSVGSPQIRAQATIAGTLLQRPRCWYFRNGISCYKNGGQTCPAVDGDNRYHAIFGGGPTHSVFHSDVGLALHALQAKIDLVTPGGDKTIAIADLYIDPQVDVTREHVLNPGEIIREIRIPKLPDRFVGTFMKIRERGSFDFAIVSVALIYNNYHGQFKNMLIFLGGVAPRPHVPQKTIDAIQFKKLSRALISPAADLAADGATPLAHNAYKIPMVKEIVREALEQTYEKLSWRPD